MSGLLRKLLIVNGKRVVTGLTKHLRSRDRQVFIELEAHQIAPEGMGTTRSRANSAA